MHHHHVRRAADAGDRRDVADELETEIVVKRRVADEPTETFAANC
jgi:hypothetical protein